MSDDNTAVDDRGTSQEEALELIERLRDEAFDSNSDELALALVRTTEQVEGWLAGEEVIDDDVVMKVRGIAQARGIKLENE